MIYPFIAMSILLSIVQYTLSTAITVGTSGLTPKAMQGTLVGLEHSLFSIAYMVGPQLGVGGLEVGGISGLSAICAVVFGAVLAVWALCYRCQRRRRAVSLPFLAERRKATVEQQQLRRKNEAMLRTAVDDGEERGEDREWKEKRDQEDLDRLDADGRG